MLKYCKRTEKTKGATIGIYGDGRKIFRKTIPGPNFPEKKIKDTVNSIECFVLFANEPRHEKTGFLHIRKQRRRSVVR